MVCIGSLHWVTFCSNTLQMNGYILKQLFKILTQLFGDTTCICCYVTCFTIAKELPDEAAAVSLTGAQAQAFSCKTAIHQKANHPEALHNGSV